MKKKIAINGLGRIGRAFLKLSLERPEIEIVAINDLADIENIAYLLRYDTAYGRSGMKVTTGAGTLTIDGLTFAYLQEKDPSKLPWKKLGVDVVVESTGFFATPDKAKAHLDAGARRVVVSAPFEGKHELVDGVEDTILLGLNEANLKVCPITSNASCTTNAASPVISVLNETIGIEKALLNTVHAYTATQRLVDSPDAKDWRRGRAGATNIVPSTTGAAVAVTKAVPALDGMFDGISLRIPVITGSIADITFVAKRPTSVKEVNQLLTDAAKEAKWKGILSVTTEQLVSSDIIGDTHASIVDLSYTKVVGGDLVKVLAWYDNEMGYTNTLVEHVIRTAQFS